jgi:uncharacterized repeat protein (TIGR02543 family)
MEVFMNKAVINRVMAIGIVIFAAAVFYGCNQPEDPIQTTIDGGANLLTVQLISSGASNPPASPVLVVDPGKTAALPEDLTKSGYVFLGWYTAADGGERFTSATPVTQNLRLYARWVADTPITVNFDANGGDTFADPAVMTIEPPAQTIENLPSDPAKSDSTEFAGWYTAQNGGIPFDPAAPIPYGSAITVYAQWGEHVVVSFNSGEPGTTPQSFDIFADGPLGQLPEPPKSPGKTFTGWFDAETGGAQVTDATTITVADGDLAIYAQWEDWGDALKLHYLFEDEDADDKIDDEIGDNHATLVDGASIETLGDYRFLKTNDSGYLDMGEGAGNIIAGLEDFTIAVYVNIENSVNLTANGNWITCFADDTPGHDKYMYLMAKTTGYGITTSSTSGKKSLELGGAMGKGAWKHIAYTQTGTTGTYYINGLAVQTGVIDITPSDLGVTTKNYLGKSVWSSDVTLKNSRIWDFRLYNRALEAGEIGELASGLRSLPVGYTVTFNFNYEGAAQPIEKKVSFGGQIGTMPVKPERSGYVFMGWHDTTAESGGNEFAADTPVSANTTVYARWIVAEETTVTFDSNGADTPAGEASRMVLKHTALGALPTPPQKTNHRFAGWFDTQANEEGTQYTSSSIIPGDITLYARWREFGLRYLFNDNGSGQAKDESGNGNHGTVVSPAIIETLGDYKIFNTKNGGYLDMGAGVGDVIDDLSDFTISVFVNIEPQVTITGNGNWIASFSSSPNISDPGGTPGSHLFLTAKEQRYAISQTNWQGENGVKPSPGAAMEKGKWKHIAYTQNGTTGTIYVDGAVLQSGTVNLLPKDLTAKVIYNYLGKPAYSNDAMLQHTRMWDFKLYERALPAEEISAVAAVRSSLPTGYTVTFDANGGTGGTAIAAPGFPSGTIAALPADPTKAGGFFKGWFTTPGLTGGTEFTTSTSVTGNTTVYARWYNGSPVTVTFDSQEADTEASPTSMEIPAGQGYLGSLPVSPVKSGKVFSGWFTGPNGTGNRVLADTIILADTTIYAKWADPVPCTITLDPQGGTLGTTTISGYVDVPVGTLPESTTPRTTLAFAGWYTQPNKGGEKYTEATVATGNVTLYARWKGLVLWYKFQRSGATITDASGGFPYDNASSSWKLHNGTLKAGGGGGANLVDHTGNTNPQIANVTINGKSVPTMKTGGSGVSPQLDMGASVGSDIIANLDDEFTIAAFVQTYEGAARTVASFLMQRDLTAGDATGGLYMLNSNSNEGYGITATNFAAAQKIAGSWIGGRTGAHFAFTQTGKTGTNNGKFYVNGVLRAEGTFTYLPADIGATTYNTLARPYNNGTDYMGNPAYVGDFRIYNRALSQSEIQALSNASDY